MAARSSSSSSLTWQVEYARFVTYPPLHTIRSTHPMLTAHTTFRRNRSSGGAWLKSSGATSVVKLIDAGSNNAVLIISLHDKTFEEHFISKLNFSWPHMSCASQLPVRGSRAVFASYKDSAGQMQIFAMRFLNDSESQSFVNSLKESLKYVTTVGTSSVNTTSQVQWQKGLITANEELYLSNDFENRDHPRDGLVECEIQEARSPIDHPGVYPNSPPGFTSRRQGSPNIEDEADLQSHAAKYMSGPSFNAMLNKLEKVLSDMGGDMTLQLP